jgi:IS4 transposase
LITLINDKDEIIQFLTNRFDLKAEEIAEIYRKIWDIELFFRWVKQYLRIKRFSRLWRDPNAVYSPIYIALITYLLTVLFKLSLNCKLSNTVDSRMCAYMAMINATLLPKSPFTKGGFQVKPKTGVGEKINNKM